MPLDLPRVVEIEPTYSCNLRCRMCHVSYMPDEPRPVLDPALIDQLDCLRGRYFIIASGFEPMMNRNFASIVRRLTAIDAQIELVTNGTLLSEENISALVDADLRMLNFSFDGIIPATYEHIRRGAEYQSTIDAILSMRQRFSGWDTLFCINSTMMKRNMHETPAIVDFWDRADFDLVRFIFMVVRENVPELIKESLYPIRAQFYRLLDWVAEDVIASGRKIAVRNPWYVRSPVAARYPDNFDGSLVHSNNPEIRLVPNPRQAYQLGAGPGMSFPCKSPWSFAKILPNGDVQLCYRFTIGNLGREDFETIWRGEAAEAVRRKVAAERLLCETCDFYRFCLSSDSLDPDDAVNYFAENLLEGLPSVDFGTGTMTLPKPAPPVLVETIDNFNIVRFNDRYLCAPHSLGSLDLQTVDPSDIPQIMIARTLHEARSAVRSITRSEG